jgi:hypothetical protein
MSYPQSEAFVQNTLMPALPVCRADPPACRMSTPPM